MKFHPFFILFSSHRKGAPSFERSCPWVLTGLPARPLPLACPAACLMLARPATALALTADCACRAHPRGSGDLDRDLKVASSPTPSSSGADSSSAVVTTCRLRLTLSRRYVRLRCLANPRILVDGSATAAPSNCLSAVPAPLCASHRPGYPCTHSLTTPFARVHPLTNTVRFPSFRQVFRDRAGAARRRRAPQGAHPPHPPAALRRHACRRPDVCQASLHASSWPGRPRVALGSPLRASEACGRACGRERMGPFVD